MKESVINYAMNYVAKPNRLGKVYIKGKKKWRQSMVLQCVNIITVYASAFVLFRFIPCRLNGTAEKPIRKENKDKEMQTL